MGERGTIEVENWDDLSGCCFRCGAEEVVQRLDLTVEWMPTWAKYLVSVDFSRIIYNKFRREGRLRIGFCAKHAQSAVKKRLKAYGSLLAACVSMGVGVLGNLPWLVLLSVILLFVFLAAIMEGTPLRASKIEGDRIWLPSKVHIKKRLDNV